jgi:hypothetical protein
MLDGKARCLLPGRGVHATVAVASKPLYSIHGESDKLVPVDQVAYPKTVTSVTDPVVPMMLQPYSSRTPMRPLTAVLGVLLLALLIACCMTHEPLVSKIPGDRREFEIVEVDYSRHQAAARITFSSSFGIFAFDLNPEGRALKSLTITIRNQRFCEGLTFQDRTGHMTELLRTQGVQVRQQATDLAIDIVPPAVNLLKGGGRVQYVNQYR